MAGESENKNKSDASSNKPADKQHPHLPSPSSHRFFSYPFLAHTSHFFFLFSYFK
jgi:hypothetical protein